MREEVVNLLRPDLTTNTDTDTGRQMGAEIIESTGHFHAKTMSKWFVGNLVGPDLDWLDYRVENRELRKQDNVRGWTQRTSEYMLEDVYAYPKSNFYETNNFFVLDGITVGSPVMLLDINELDGQYTCRLPHFTENFLMRDYFGNDVAYHQKFEMTNFQAMQAFGKTLPKGIGNELDQGNYKTKHKYLRCIARVGDPVFHYDKPRPDSQIPLLKAWVQVWFSLDSVGSDEKKPLGYILSGNRLVPTIASGYDYKPFHSWHYARLPHETYSRTPGWESLPDVRGLNAAWMTIHDTAYQYANPATLALDSLRGKLKLGGRGITFLSEQEYDRRPIPYQNTANYAWAMDFVDRRSDTVGRHFFSDIARLIQNHTQRHKQQPTAFQVAQMINEAMVLIGPAITTYAGPYLHGIDQQFLEMEMASGRLQNATDPPDEVLEADLQPVFVGPLIEQLKQSMIAKKIQQPLMMAAPMMELWPEAKDMVKAGDLMELLLEKSDFPQQAIRTAEEYEQIQEAKAAEQRQIALLDKAKQESEIAKNLQGETAEGSPLQKLGAA
jgi:hypothetical protein